MKIKTCSWLDSNIRGGLSILGDRLYPCCWPATPSTPLYEDENLDYSKISVEELQKKRKQFQMLINEGKACQGCEEIIEKEESEINIGPITYLSIGLFDTCSLRCKYCYFTDEQLGSRPNRTKLLPMIKTFSNGGLLKESFALGLAGGEPSLIEDIPETLAYITEHTIISELSFISNCSIKNRAKELAKKFPNIDKKMWKRLYTSIDCGTPETFETLKCRNLFYTVCNNIINYAKTSSFEEIILKYILMFDHINTGDKDIFGFLYLVKNVIDCQKGKVGLTIDYDMLNPLKIMDEEMIAAAGKLYYCATKIFNIPLHFCGGALVESTKNGSEAIKKIKEYAENYENIEKSDMENYYLEVFKNVKRQEIIRPVNDSQSNLTQSSENDLQESTNEIDLSERTPKLPFYEQIFSVRNEKAHKVIRIFGIKIKLRRA